MSQLGFFNPLEKALRFYAGLALAVILFQCVGLVMYLFNVWPEVRLTTSRETAWLAGLAVLMGLVRSCVWIRIYWDGARVLSIRRIGGESRDLAERLGPILARLTRLLVASCILDVLFLPAYFVTDVFFPFSLAGWRLGVVEVARVLFPQAFGLAALILAFLTHHYRELLEERGRMKQELELTI